jgi:hypothetical protein
MVKKGEELFQIETHIDHYAKLAEARDAKLQDADDFTYSYLNTLHERLTDVLPQYTEDEQIITINRLGVHAEAYAWMLGDILITIKAMIADGTKTGYSSLTDWFYKNSDRIKISRSNFFKYITIRETIPSLEAFRKLGVNKSAIVAQIKDETKRAEVIEHIVKKDLSIPKAEEYVEAVVKQDLTARMTAKERERRKNDRAVLVTVKLPDPKGILMRFQSQRERDIANDYLQDIMPAMKKRILERENS